MPITAAFLARPGSSLGERVAALAPEACRVLDTRDPRVRIEGGAVLWNGLRLDQLDSVVVEAPLVAWPQPVAAARAGESFTELQRRGIAQRERTALHTAALRLAAARARVANDPTRAADLAMSPALALERLEAAGVPVRPWRLGSAASAGTPDVHGTVRAASTAERGLARANGGTCLAVELGANRVARHLCVGGDWLGATRATADLAPLSPPIELAGGAPGATDREIAARALTALALEFGCVHVCAGAVAFVEAAPDLEAWDLASDGRVAQALANWLVRVPLTTR